VKVELVVVIVELVLLSCWGRAEASEIHAMIARESFIAVRVLTMCM
jgi:hypothetical protein